MSVLAVNLKHLYQRRAYWPVYLIIGLLECWAIMTTLGYTPLTMRDLLFLHDLGLMPLIYPLIPILEWNKARFVGPVFLALPIGIFVAKLPKEVVTRPFSYCLPGHQEVPGKFVLTVGIVTNMLGSLLFLAHPDLDGWQRVTAVCSAFGAGLTMYWVGVWYVWSIGICFACMVFFAVVIEFIPYVGMVALSEQTIIEVPFEITVLGIASTLAGLWSLAGKDHARRLCAEPRPGYPDAGDSEKVQRHSQSIADSGKEWVTGHPRAWVDDFFLGRMNRCDHMGMRRHIWGGLYTTYAVALSKWKWNVILLSAICAYLLVTSEPSSHDADTGRTFFLFLLPGVIVSNLRLPVYSGVPTPQGRRERLFRAATVAVSITALATAAVAITIAISVLLARIITPIEIEEGVYFKFHALDIRYSSLLFLAMPIVLTLKLIECRRTALVRFSVYVLFWLAISIPEPVVRPIPIATFVVLSWGVFAAVLWYVCMKRPLVGQSRGD